ncbi:MAG: PAS domain S-box protein, partial [Coprothermobacterota bacterium]|nr:PAS domain S-box protein [Coprothermobacterota bacterium]
SRLKGDVSHPRYAFRLVARDGSIKWVEIGAVLVDWEGKPATLNFLADITERKQAEEALREERNLFVSGPTVVFRWQPGLPWLVKYASPNVQELLGYPPEAFTSGSLSFADVIHPDDIDRLVQEQSNYDREGQTYYEQEYRLQRSDGQILWVHDSTRTVIVAGSRQDSGYITDITDRKRAEAELQKLASVVRYAGEMVNLATLDGKMIFLNEAGSRMLGISPTEVEQTHIMQVISDPFKQKVENELLPALMNVGTWAGDLQYLNLKTGHLTDVQATTFVVKDPTTGAPLYLANVSIDISERKRAEEALQESEHRLADIIDFLPDATFAINLKGEVIAWNRSLEELTGATKEELIGKGDFAYSVPFYGKTGPMLIDLIFQDREEIEKNYDYLVRREDQVVAEAFVPALRGGKGVYLWGIASPLYDSSGSIVGAIESLRDISERKQAEEELRLAKLVVENSPTVVFRWSPEPGWPVEYVTDNITLFGFQPEELVQNRTTLVEMVHPDDHQQVVREIEQHVLRGEDHFRQEYRLVSPAGEVHWVDDRTTLIRDATGNVLHYQGTVTDISERKRLEAEVEKAQMDFLFAVSHELKTPLLIMSAAEELVELLPVEQRVERFRDYADVWKRNLIRLRTIIDNLVDSQRSPRTGMKLSPQPTDLGALVEHALEELAPLAQKKSLGLQREIDLLRPLSLDPEACVRILTNLLTNAIKFSLVSGEIRIKLREEGDQAVLQIHDEGPGIPADEMPNLFQPFRRGSDSVRTVVPGTGLGLYVCRILTEAQGGTIDLESAVGRGTTVTVRFPLTDGSLASSR